MTKDIAIADEVPFLGADWFDPLEAGVRQHIRGFIENLLEEELAATLRRGRYDRSTAAAGRRNGHRDRRLLGTFGPMTVSVPRARVTGSNGRQAEWRSKTLPAYKRLTRAADRWRPFGWHQHATGPARLGGAVRRGGWQGHRQPDLAQGAVRLGGLAEARSCRGRRRPPDPRRYGGPSSPRPEGDHPLGVGGAGRSS
jgi:hypothetical protein